MEVKNKSGKEYREVIILRRRRSGYFGLEYLKKSGRSVVSSTIATSRRKGIKEIMPGCHNQEMTVNLSVSEFSYVFGDAEGQDARKED